MQKIIPISLTEAQLGLLTVHRVDSLEDPNILRLCQMGIVAGVKLELLRKGRLGSPFLVRVNQTLLCLDDALAHKIAVMSLRPSETSGDSL